MQKKGSGRTPDIKRQEGRFPAVVLMLATLAACGGGSGGGRNDAATATPTGAPIETATPPPSATPTEVSTRTPTALPAATATAPATSTPTGSPTLAPTESATTTPTEVPTTTPTRSSTLAPGAISIGEAVARDADGVALRLGQTITTEGVVTVSAGLFANMKLKVFMQDGPDGIMVYHQSSGDVDAFQQGDRLRATGVVRQQDPVPDNNVATGTVIVDLTGRSWTVLARGEELPDPVPVTMAELDSGGDRYTGSLVRITNVRKVSGQWPGLGSRSTEVDVSDDGGQTVLTLRLQRNAITADLVAKLEQIGDNGAFALVAIVVQDDMTDDGQLFDGYELWPRGGEDVEPAGT